MKSYQDKFIYLADRQSWVCPIALEKNKLAEVTDLHHYRCHNTRPNRKKYPLLIDSLLNLVAVNNAYHLSNGSWGRASDLECERIEKFLERHPKIAKWVNDPE